MNKSELITYVVEANADLSKAVASKIVDDVFAGIKHGVTKDGSVAIVGHGTYNIVERSAREGRNPRTGQTMQIPASKSVKFKPGKDLKDEANKS